MTRLIITGRGRAISAELRRLQRTGLFRSGPPISVATRTDQPARERGIARQPERKPGNAVTVQQSRSEPLPVPHENGSGTLERIVRWSNSEPAVFLECAVLIGCLVYIARLAA